MARELQSTSERMRSLCDLIVHVYGTNNLASFSFLKAIDAMDRVKYELQAQALQDLPGHAKDVFYR